MVPILILEADHCLCNALCEALNLEGFDAVGVQHGDAGLAALTRFSPALILCDSVLSDMNGFEVIHHIRLNPDMWNIPVIFMTCYSSPYYVQQALDLGANDYLIKPFDIEDLLQLIDKYVLIEP